MKTRIALTTLVILFVTGIILVDRRPPTPVVAATESSAKNRVSTPPRHFIGNVQGQSSEPPTTNLARRLLNGEDQPRLTPAQLEGYLQANHRSADSLLAALYTSGDHVFLREAMEKYPNDPKVAYIAVLLERLSPEEARQRSDNYKRTDPNNQMADYISALNYFKSGQTDLALQDMTAASGKARWSDYSAEFIQNTQEAYRAAGYSELDALASAESGLLLPDLGDLKQLSMKIRDLAKSYQAAGDTASERIALQMDIQLGQQLSASESQPLITTLVGIAIERNTLSSMDSTSAYDSSGQTVQDRLNHLLTERDQIRNMSKQALPLLQQMPDQDLLIYFEREKHFGSANAFRWAVNKYGQP